MGFEYGTEKWALNPIERDPQNLYVWFQSSYRRIDVSVLNNSGQLASMDVREKDR